MVTNAPALEVIRLWPSVFLEADLPDYQAPAQRLMALAESHPGDGVFAMDDAGVQWLKSQVAHGVAAYLRETGNTGAPQWGARGRFETQGFGDYRGLANRPGADLAGMFVLRWSSTQSAADQRDDGLPGTMSFYDPRVAMNMNAIKRDPYHDYHRHVRPRAGLLLMWPAHVSYFLHPNRSQQANLRVDFDVTLHARTQSA
jgi:hypothetical protein